VIKHVMSGINPQGCQVFSFKQPSAEELDHNYMWRSAMRLPERGRIGIFNRSYYEEVLVVRVHKELLARQHIPPNLLTRRIWRERFEDIRAFEHYLSRNGVVIRKFFLHLSRQEQRRRFLERLDNPDNNWKFSISDATEREHWDEYMTAYDEMIRYTATPYAPWFVVPADKKWFTRIVVAAAVVAISICTIRRWTARSARSFSPRANSCCTRSASGFHRRSQTTIRNGGRSRSLAQSGCIETCSTLGAHSSRCEIVKLVCSNRLTYVPIVRCCLITPGASQFVVRGPSSR
jgi:PPK2 family polyphosphate:nucleotide phosphotransferase